MAICGRLNTAMDEGEACHILWKKTGRPKGGPVEDFATFLGEFYVETTGRSFSPSWDNYSNEFTGPTSLLVPRSGSSALL